MKKNHPVFFLTNLDYVSRVPENHLEHSTPRSEGYTDRVCGTLFAFCSDFYQFWRKVSLFSRARPVDEQKFHFHSLQVVASPRLLGVGWATGA